MVSLEGIWKVRLNDGSEWEMKLPGSLDENNIGYKDIGANQWHPDAELGNAEETFDENAPIATRFTRKHTYEGPAYISKKIMHKENVGKRTFIEVERARVLSLKIDGNEVAPFIKGSLSTPYIFEVTGLCNGEHEYMFISDNSYPGLPHDAIVYSSAATDETQTNWNGLLGYVRLREEENTFINSISIYPHIVTNDESKNVSSKDMFINVKLSVDAIEDKKVTVMFGCDAIEDDSKVHGEELLCHEGSNVFEFKGIRLKPDVKLWDTEEGNLYDFTATIKYDGIESGIENNEISDYAGNDTGNESKTVQFGIRSFGDNGKGRLAVNGRTIFLRSEANCAEFPETGHPPMTVEEWEKILKLYSSYGINCMRFHSHCPPEAAFTAADRMGMLMQPELSHWNPKDAFETDESFNYYMHELTSVVEYLANHPSFVMLTLGNELHASELGHKRMDELVNTARAIDNTRLYANASNPHYGNMGCDVNSDFYTSQNCHDKMFRGTSAGMNGYINTQYPNAMTNYDKSLEFIRESYQKPVFSFEVGQFEVLPDFKELDEFKGISDPANYRIIRDKAEKSGLLDVWEKYVEATGELSRIGYREEIEAAMRTKELSGISLLGLQDFPGQGTALVGMINSHMEPKPYEFAKPEKFKAFFKDSMPLLQLERYTYEAGECLEAEIIMANFGKQDITAKPEYLITGDGVHIKGMLDEVTCPRGGQTSAGWLKVQLGFVQESVKLEITVKLGDSVNTYPVWVYKKVKPRCPEDVYETKVFDDKAAEVLAEGGKVYLSPESTKDALPDSIKAQFTTDFWSVGTFPFQEGAMGQLIDDTHPIFRHFPTENHTNWQWWIMATKRAVILPRTMKSIITEMDSYAYMRPMAQLFECKCGGGKLLFSSMGLQDIKEYPEARALLDCIYSYMASDEFEPEEEMNIEEIKKISGVN